MGFDALQARRLCAIAVAAAHKFANTFTFARARLLVCEARLYQDDPARAKKLLLEAEGAAAHEFEVALVHVELAHSLPETHAHLLEPALAILRRLDAPLYLHESELH
jgi:hypothetical protein